MQVVGPRESEGTDEGGQRHTEAHIARPSVAYEVIVSSNDRVSGGIARRGRKELNEYVEVLKLTPRNDKQDVLTSGASTELEQSSAQSKKRGKQSERASLKESAFIGTPLPEIPQRACADLNLYAVIEKPQHGDRYDSIKTSSKVTKANVIYDSLEEASAILAEESAGAASASQDDDCVTATPNVLNEFFRDAPPTIPSLTSSSDERKSNGLHKTVARPGLTGKRSTMQHEEERHGPVICARDVSARKNAANLASEQTGSEPKNADEPKVSDTDEEEKKRVDAGIGSKAAVARFNAALGRFTEPDHDKSWSPKQVYNETRNDKWSTTLYWKTRKLCYCPSSNEQNFPWIYFPLQRGQLYSLWRISAKPSLLRRGSAAKRCWQTTGWEV